MRAISSHLSAVIKWSFLLVLAIVTLYPVLMTFLGSFKSNLELTAGSTILPSDWRFENYVTAWKQANFAKFTWNSLYISSMTTILTLIVSSMAAYVVDRRNFIGKRFVVALQASTMFISVGAIVMRPQFDLMIALGLNDSLWGLIIVLTSSHAGAFFILLGFLKAVPRDLDEAAYIDGSGFLSVYWRIVLPLLKPGLGVIALFAFRGAWNEYVLPLVFTMNSPNLQPLTVGLAQLRYGYSAAEQTHLMMAGACLSILPILVVYIFANKSFMQVTAGSVKG
ncbi:carbohydrate ABC transporter permease [Paenibacillus sp. PL2-23]|uniref:carbohydrate ABC transporter permease n=1 Tax=Paenibacillus sp. PL2-23 TaxID=2100729 RepID=UPI0030F87C63